LNTGESKHTLTGVVSDKINTGAAVVTRYGYTLVRVYKTQQLYKSAVCFTLRLKIILFGRCNVINILTNCGKYYP